jgi:hypothetical protein
LLPHCLACPRPSGASTSGRNGKKLDHVTTRIETIDKRLADPLLQVTPPAEE